MNPSGAHRFKCIDAHTCGNPVRLILEGCPELDGETMLDKREHFLSKFDWIRTGLMFEPRGHAQMSGSMLYPSARDDCDIGVLFVETSGCLPMCGHGLIGTVTIAVEHELVHPATPGILAVETPAGRVTANYTLEDGKVRSVRIANVPSFLHSQKLEVDFPELGGTLTADVAYGGNFYAIVEPQDIYSDLGDLSAADVVRISPRLRERFNKHYKFVHPGDERVHGLTHVLWTGKPLHELKQGMRKFPQTMINVPVSASGQARMAESDRIRLAVTDIERKLNGEGRVILRPSGTEPLIRVTLEGRDADSVQQLAEELAETVRQALGE